MSFPETDPLPPALLMVDATAQRGVKAPFGWIAGMTCALGTPPVTPRFGAMALEELEPTAATGWSSISSHQDTNRMSQPSFKERTALLRAAADKLHGLAEIVLAEVQHMEAAQMRFTERRTRTQKASR